MAQSIGCTSYFALAAVNVSSRVSTAAYLSVGVLPASVDRITL